MRLPAGRLGGEEETARPLGDEAHVLEQRDAVAHARAVAARHAGRSRRAAAVRRDRARRQLYLRRAARASRLDIESCCCSALLEQHMLPLPVSCFDTCKRP